MLCQMSNDVILCSLKVKMAESDVLKIPAGYYSCYSSIILIWASYEEADEKSLFHSEKGGLRPM